MLTPPFERRSFPRGHVSGTAEVRPLVGKRSRYLVEDVSEGGVRLRGAEALGVGVPARLTLALSGLPILQLSGVVVRAEQASAEAVVALAFRNVSAAARDQLGQAVLRSVQAAARSTVLVSAPALPELVGLVQDLLHLRYCVHAFLPEAALAWAEEARTAVHVAVLSPRLDPACAAAIVSRLEQHSPDLVSLTVDAATHDVAALLRAS